MSFRERLEWLGRIALLAFILASAAFLSAIMAMRLAIQGREVLMPDVAGKVSREAQTALQGRGLGMKVEDRIYSNQPLDTVVRQSPPPGIRVKVGQYAHVVLSLGPQKVTIPSFSDKSLRAARIELLRNGLQLGEVSSAYLSAAPADSVVKQEPPAGSTGASSPHVDLLVSLGPRPLAYVMPDLAGLSLSQAQSRLTASGLKLSKITTLPLTGVPRATVTSQLPVRGARVEAGASVELHVAE
jgi:eukaryotic-like serine/threonine-protein kinase